MVTLSCLFIFYKLLFRILFFWTAKRNFITKTKPKPKLQRKHELRQPAKVPKVKWQPWHPHETTRKNTQNEQKKYKAFWKEA